MFLVSILIGGVITGNILGDMKQKTAEVVFFIWKGIQVFRKRVIPSNPRSPDQTTQRDFFTGVLRLGQDINTSVIKPFWKHLAIKKSEFNAWMSYHLLNLSSITNYANIKLCLGSLLATPIVSAVYTAGTGILAITWSSTPSGDQTDEDIAYVACYDENLPGWSVDTVTSRTRDNGSFDFDIGAGRTAGKLHAYLWFSNVAVGEPLYKQSTSDYSVVTAP